MATETKYIEKKVDNTPDTTHRNRLVSSAGVAQAIGVVQNELTSLKDKVKEISVSESDSSVNELAKAINEIVNCFKESNSI